MLKNVVEIEKNTIITITHLNKNMYQSVLKDFLIKHNFLQEIMGRKKASNELSKAEIQKNYRSRKKEKDAEKSLADEQARWHRRRTSEKVKVVSDLTEREHRLLKK